MEKISESKIRTIFECADRQREIEKYLQELLYDNAKANNLFCTWLIEYPTYNKNVGFEFKIEVTTEDKKHKSKKIFFVEYDWENEKKNIKEIVLYLLNQLIDKPKEC